MIPSPLLPYNPAMRGDNDTLICITPTIDAVIAVIERRWADYRPADLFPTLAWTVIFGDPVTTPDPPVIAVFLNTGEHLPETSSCGGNFPNELDVIVRSYLRRWEGANKNVVDRDATRVLDALTLMFRKHRYLKDGGDVGRRRTGLPASVGITSEIDSSRQDAIVFRRYVDLHLNIKTLDTVESDE